MRAEVRIRIRGGGTVEREKTGRRIPGRSDGGAVVDEEEGELGTGAAGAAGIEARICLGRPGCFQIIREGRGGESRHPCLPISNQRRHVGSFVGVNRAGRSISSSRGRPCANSAMTVWGATRNRQDALATHLASCCVTAATGCRPRELPLLVPPGSSKGPASWERIERGPRCARNRPGPPSSASEWKQSRLEAGLGRLAVFCGTRPQSPEEWLRVQVETTGASCFVLNPRGDPAAVDAWMRGCVDEPNLTASSSSSFVPAAACFPFLSGSAMPERIFGGSAANGTQAPG